MPMKVYTVKDAAALAALPWYQALRASASSTGEAAQAVADIIADVRARGDVAVVHYMRKWTDASFTQQRMRVGETELARALAELDTTLREALERSIANVRAYQQHILPPEPKPTTISGGTLGLRFTPIERVGVAVPGGRAAYPSSVIMLVVPALVAGVEPDNITVVSPPPTTSDGQASGDISPLVLAACALLGVKNVCRIGGAQAIAALALGTDTIAPVDLVVGPGNIYTQLAKQQLAGVVGIDGFYGPSEIVTIADESADPARVASDLIAQAEHDPGKCFLVSWSQPVIDAVLNQIKHQLPGRRRLSAIEQSLAGESAVVFVPDEATAIAVADRIAAEHVNLAVRDPRALLARLKHGGEFFLGDTTPVAAGDYYAGPSHCLPTGTTARFASGVSVYTFLKRSGWVHYEQAMPPEAVTTIARLAEAEGLDGHAASARARR